MTRCRELLRRLIAIVRPAHWDREFDEEREVHLQLAADDLERQGRTPAQARREARLAFGGHDAALEGHRDARGLPALESVMRDLRYALRGLRRDAGLAVAAILMLALGIGANTAVFSLVRPILLQPIPFDRPEELVWIANTNTGGLSGQTFQVDTYEGLRRETRSIRDWTAYFAFSDFGSYTLTGHGDPERVMLVNVAPRFFELLGVHPAAGRLFSQDEYGPNGPLVVLIDHDYWQRRFGGDPGIVGSQVTINDRSTLVAGILPASFDFASVFAPGSRVDLFAPAILADMRPWGNTLAVIGRLAPGASIEQARAELEVVGPALREGQPALFPFGTTVTTLQAHVTGSMRQPLSVLWGAVGLVLLLVCANVSNLLLSRSSARTKEFAIRLALGAARRRVVQQLALEGLLLAGFGAALGIPLAFALTEWLKQFVTLAIPLLHHARVDGAALAATGLVSVATALAFSLLPALRLVRVHPRSALADQSRGTTAGRRMAWVRSGLAIAEVAIASVLLIGAGLLTRSLLHLLDADLGFRPAGATVVTVRMPENRPDAIALLTESTRRVRALPGVTAAGLTDALPLDRNRSWSVGVPGQIYRAGERPNVFVYVVSPGYLDAMGISLRAGRDLLETDTSDRPLAVVVSRSLARALYPAADPIARAVEIQGTPRTIVGVVDDVRQSRLDEATALQIYLPYAQGGGLPAELVVRSAVDVSGLVPSIRQTLADLDPTLLVAHVRPVSDLVDRSVSPRRFLVSLIGGFSLFALLLASLGIYGVVSYGVSQREQEIGVRIALGATAAAVRRQILRGTLRLALAGIAIGLVGAWLLGRLVAALLFDTSPTDPGTFGLTAALLITVAAMAAYVPALRASRIQPMRALQGN